MLAKTILALGTIAVVAASFSWFGSEKVDYNTQVKPLLNKHCLKCHGGVKHQGDFNLLTRELALQPAESGKPAIVPGNADKSEMIRRLTCSDPEERMPYQKDPLSREEVDILTQWINEGAQWDVHWAYRTIQAPEVPMPKASIWNLWQPKTNNWVRNDIDWYIFDRLKQEKMTPSPEADKAALLQRVSLDLIGLPAPDSVSQAFLTDNSAEAYEKLVDTLLASKHFGERWASVWLDIARYADTKGYERDASRDIWKYRDWVIRAFNADMPYNHFLTEQLAGDLLPNPTDDQYIATAFHRNTMTNDEGGTDNEEFRVAAVMDRVNTTWEALMGTTFACVQCHSHPYDPFMHEEYYKFFAFFNNSRDEDSYEEYPLLRHFSKEDSLKLLELKAWLQQYSPDRSEAIVKLIKTYQPTIYSLAADTFVNCDLYDTKWLTMRNHALSRIRNVQLDGKTQLIYRYGAGKEKGRWTVRLDRPDGPVLFSTAVAPTKYKKIIHTIDFQAVSGTHDLWFQYENPLLKKPEDGDMFFDWFHFTTPFPGKDQPGYAAMEKEFWRLLRAETPATPIMLDPTPDLARETRVFERGNWLVKGEKVSPGVPKHLFPMPANAPQNRLGMAQWMTDPNHPLTSRTAVNRVWEQIFGLGLAETLEDLGTQGIPPVHRALLDYLAWNFMHEHQWSLKKLLRQIVCSATYRQRSTVTDVALAQDPYNRFCGRGPRVRLSAEQIRDRTLAVSGLLSEKMYGPGVMPFQPEGIWNSPWNDDPWKLSEGEDRYRRAIYTFWKRGAPYPSMMTFDGASREVCTARRVRTNTPLQALVTLNDSAYVEAARYFAQKIEKSGIKEPDAQIQTAYQQAIGQTVLPEKMTALKNLYQKALETFRENPEAAKELLGLIPPPPPKLKKGEKPTPPAPKQPIPENVAATAALTVTTNAIFNLDEFVTKG
jgi:mono/diheme cytochrome c family protein